LGAIADRINPEIFFAYSSTKSHSVFNCPRNSQEPVSVANGALVFGTPDIAKTKVLDIFVLMPLDAAVRNDGVGVYVNETYGSQLRSRFDKTEASMLGGAIREPPTDAIEIKRPGIS
jgi:hypothetical protein